MNREEALEAHARAHRQLVVAEYRVREAVAVLTAAARREAHAAMLAALAGATLPARSTDA